MSRRVLPLILALLLIAPACNKAKQQSSDQNQPNNASQQQQAATQPQTTPPPEATPPPAQTPPKESTAAMAPKEPAKARTPMPRSEAAPPPKPAVVQAVVIPAGTPITIRLAQTIDAKTSKAGDTFEGTVAHPVVVNGVTLVPASSPVTGTVVAANPPGKFSGEGNLSIRLTQIGVKGTSFPISTASIGTSIKGKGKRSAVAIGGGTAGGALIGGIAGGGKGAAIGALVGGGAGTAGAAMTGNKALAFPAESALTFKLQHPVTLKKGSGAQGEEPPEQPESQQ
jgi:hypothetical protein